MTADFPGISIVIIGRNEGERLGRCLQSVREATYPSDGVELIYADSGSTDDSCALAARRGARVIRMTPERPAAAIGRNAGFRCARHDFVQFLDGDTILDKEWLGKAVRAMDDSAVACVFGRREERAPHATLYNFWTHHDWYVAPGLAESCAGDAMFRRDVLERAGGYDESLIAGEEPDLCYRIRSELGKTILCLDEPMTLHDINMTRFAQYWRRCTRTGYAYAEVGGRHRGLRSWRVARWRNLFYASGTPVAVILSIGFGSLWPILVWAVLLAAAVLRNACRLRSRMDSLGSAIRYSVHHYLSKTPMALGQSDYWLRTRLRHSPRRLIEYRQ